MGVKKKYCSEYRTSFKSKYPCFTKVYEQNLGYRIERRSVEHFHHAEPFLWDTESSGTDSDQTNCAGVANPHSLPLHIYKHEKYNKAYRDHLEKLKQKFESSLKVTTPQNNVQDKAVMTTSHNLRQEQTQTNSAELAVRDKIERDGSHDRHRNGGDDRERMSSTSSLDREEPSHSGRRTISMLFHCFYGNCYDAGQVWGHIHLYLKVFKYFFQVFVFELIIKKSICMYLNTFIKYLIFQIHFQIH